MPTSTTKLTSGRDAGARRRTRARVFGLLAPVLAAAVVLPAGAASAGGGGASVVRDGGTCMAADSSGSWLFSCSIQFVAQPDGSINQHITGQVIAEESSPLPSRPVSDFEGQPCLVLGGQVLTRVTTGIVTPSGQVKLTCRS